MGEPFQFTCPSRSTTPNPRADKDDYVVSIHVPLAEHDSKKAALWPPPPVSIHVPLAEHDRNISYIV